MMEYLTSSYFLVLMIKIIVIFGGVMGSLAYLSWIERKVIARVQMRPGPTRVGPFGLLQPIADGLKFLFKEDVIPTKANTFLYLAAPVVSLIPALLSFSVIPFGPWLQVTDLSVGLLFIFAITSLGLPRVALRKRDAASIEQHASEIDRDVRGADRIPCGSATRRPRKTRPRASARRRGRTGRRGTGTSGGNRPA